MLFFTPLEQFQIVPLLNAFRTVLLTNETIFIFLVLVFFKIFFDSLINISNDKTLLILPTNYHAALERLHSLILSLIKENIKGKNGQVFFPFVLTLFLFVLSLNLIGLIPYSFTVTSHLIITLTLSLSSFIGINILSIRKYGVHFFSIFLPGGTNILLALLLVPIEVISYVFKPISLSIRLFANLMAGHALLKVIAGFATTLMVAGGFFIVLHYLPIFVLVPLYALELGVALIQSFVFAVLLCIYINDSLNISH